MDLGLRDAKVVWLDITTMAAHDAAATLWQNTTTLTCR